jgi:cysteine desulfurase/selenocysteine lyase
VLKFIPVTLPEGVLDLSNLDALLTPKTKLLAMTHMSNVLGTVNPLEDIIKRAKARGVTVLIDGAQSAPHRAVDVQKLGCDFFAFSAHKMLGPTGVGVLWGRRDLLEKMPPFLGGGDMISQVWLDHYTPNDLPHKFEAGTPDIADVAAFGAAVDYLSALGLDAVQKHEEEITAYALKVLKRDFPEATFYGTGNLKMRGGVVSMNIPGVHPHDVGTILDEAGVAVRVGHHCCQPLMHKLKVPGTVRASFYIYNTLAEVDVLSSALKEVTKYFGAVHPAR